MKHLLLSVILFGFLAQLSPTFAQADDTPPRCRWRLAIAVPDQGNTSIAFNGTIVAPNGYVEGFGSGGVGAGSGKMRLEISHPLLGEITEIVDLKAQMMNTIVVYVKEETEDDEVIRNLKVSTFTAPLDGGDQSGIYCACTSNSLSTTLSIGGTTARLGANESKLISLKSGGAKEVKLGDQSLEVEIISGKASPLVVIYDDTSGKQKIAASY